jgi:hypothetical protein
LKILSCVEIHDKLNKIGITKYTTLSRLLSRTVLNDNKKPTKIINKVKYTNLSVLNLCSFTFFQDLKDSNDIIIEKIINEGIENNIILSQILFLFLKFIKKHIKKTIPTPT